jgi:hypothetical protein
MINSSELPGKPARYIDRPRVNVAHRWYLPAGSQSVPGKLAKTNLK